ncbi:hypothetical protein D9754_10085 [Planomicrobium sp. Y74]|nr:hypothetical protein D9754_10085 [Planomicrobium sp. Y74]
MGRILVVQSKNEHFSLLVKRARKRAVLKTILISAGTSFLFHCLIREKFLGHREKGWKRC